MISVDYLRRYAGIDPDVATDDEVERILAAARAWYASAGVPLDADSPLYDEWVTNLAAWMYDHRGSGEAIPAGYVVSVHQMRPKKV